MGANKNLHAAKTAKNDEFYTRFEDVQNELCHYKEHFAGKTVLCNCDDPTWSVFWQYFHLLFAEWKLKKLIATHYDPVSPTYKIEYTGGDDTNLQAGVITPLAGNGDFRNQECLELLDEADIVVTNPPFSLFRTFVSTIIEHGKDFVVIGNTNAVTYKEFFPLIKEGKARAGWSFNKTIEFIMPDSYQLKGKAYIDENGKKHGFVPSISWYTTLDLPKHHERLICYKSFNKADFPMYDNYAAFNVDKVCEIPVDKEFRFSVSADELAEMQAKGFEIEIENDRGNELDIVVKNPVLGVPITFLDKYNPEEFEIVAFRKGEDGKDLVFTRERERIQPYFRMLVRRRYTV